METFESKLKRVGFKINSLSESINEIILVPSNGKIFTGVILVFLSIPLIALLSLPIVSIISTINGNEFGFSLSIISISLLLGLLGIVLFYRGNTRLFRYLGFKIQLKPNELKVQKRKDLRLESSRVNGIQKFQCSQNENIITVSCTLTNGDQVVLLNERNSIEDCLPVLEKLTDKFNEISKRN